MMIDYYDDREFVQHILRRFQEEFTLRETRAFLEAGVKVVFGSWYYSSLSAGWSPQIFRDLFVPLIKEHVDLVHSYGALYEYYDDGKVMPIIEDLKNCGIDGFTTLCPPPMGDVDIADIKRRIGDSVCLHGGVDLLGVMKEGTPRLIEQTVKELISAAGPCGLILGTSDSIRNGTPVENVKAFFAAGRKYGKA
jgi:uroporphyrinogen decarboxylase